VLFCHVISLVEKHDCTNCDIFRHTYDKLQCHRFSNVCGVRHKIYDNFFIVIVVHLTHTFCDDGLLSQWCHQNTSYDEKTFISDVIIISQKT
jgi:hypothetical protein